MALPHGATGAIATLPPGPTLPPLQVLYIYVCI